MGTIEIETIVIRVHGNRMELTVEEAQQLKAELLRLMPDVYYTPNYPWQNDTFGGNETIDVSVTGKGKDD